MKSFNIYIALFAFLLAFNVSSAAKLRITPDDLPAVAAVPDVILPANADGAAVAAVAAVPAVSGVSQEFGTFFPTITVKKLEFTKLDNTLCFSDLGVNSEGIIVGVGLDGKLYEYAFADNKFVEIVPEYEISNLWRVDINYDGIIYVITRCGDTYYLDCEKRWVKLPGCAIDIGAGRSGEIHKIGCEKPENCKAPAVPGVTTKPSSPHVYKLICSCNCKCCDRRCKVFIKKYVYATCEPAEKRICYWIKLPNDLKDLFGRPIKFTRIDTKFTGFPIVTEGDRTVYEFFGGDENKFKKIYEAPIIFTDINDIASDNDGNDFYCTDLACYIITGASSETRILDYNGFSKGGSDVSVGPFGMISFINDNDHLMYTVAKVGFN